jgi:thiamine biosynthesis lipoprotein
VERAVEGWRVTGGAYDPTVLPSLLAAGYDDTFERVASRRDGPRRLRLAAPPGPAGARVDRRASTVSLPRGVAFDPGGIGKGLAADLVVSGLRARGALGACVNVAGDVRAAGAPPSDRGWEIAVEDPYDPSRELTRVVVDDGAVCTSSRLLRNWKAAGRRVHHLIDPATGWPTRTDVSAATVVARQAWLAEVLTKVLFVRGAEAGGAVVHRLGATGFVVDHEGRSTALSDFEELVSCS